MCCRTPTLQLDCLNRAAEFALQTKKIELRFMGLVKRLKAAYDVCAGSEEIAQQEREQIHFYLARIEKIKLPNTRMQLLQKMLAKAISDFQKINQLQGINFSKRFQTLVELYNQRKENDELNGEEFDDFTQQMTDMIYDLKSEMTSFSDMGIDLEEKAFLDILEHMCVKYQFTYDDAKMLALAKEMKVTVDNNPNIRTGATATI